MRVSDCRLVQALFHAGPLRHLFLAVPLLLAWAAAGCAGSDGPAAESTDGGRYDAGSGPPRGGNGGDGGDGTTGAGGNDGGQAGGTQSASGASNAGGTNSDSGASNAGGTQGLGGANHAGGAGPSAGGAHAGAAQGGSVPGPDASTPNDGAVAVSDSATSADGDTTGAPSASAILSKIARCTGSAIQSGFTLDGDGSGSISIYQCGNAAYWKADMDVDCDGIQTPPCDTDQTGQPQTSIVDDAPNGDVDPTKLPYFVIPLGNPESTWYRSYGIELGQIGAVVYQEKVVYGIFADEAGGAFIGEASYAMCQLFLGKPGGSHDPCDPNEGGIDPADVTYVAFTGSAERATGQDIYDHEKHTALGRAAAAAWIAQ